MREISTLELAIVSGGGILEDIIEFFSRDGNSSAGTIQQVHVVGRYMTDTQKFAYDIQQIRNSLPDCQITFATSGTVANGTVNVSVTAGIPTVGGSGAVTTTGMTTTYVCPPKSGIPQNPSN